VIPAMCLNRLATMVEFGLKAPLDPQNGGLGVIPAQSVFFVHAWRSPTCNLFVPWHGVWSPSGPQAGDQVHARPLNRQPTDRGMSLGFRLSLICQSDLTGPSCLILPESRQTVLPLCRSGSLYSRLGS